MTIQELNKYLKENLKIKVVPPICYESVYTLELILNNKVISQSILDLRDSQEPNDW